MKGRAYPRCNVSDAAFLATFLVGMGAGAGVVLLAAAYVALRITLEPMPKEKP